MNVRRKLENPKTVAFAFFGAMAVVMSIVGALSYHSLVAVQEAVQLRGRARMILLGAEKIQTHLFEAESAQRGYVLTGEKRYLRPYHRVVDIIPAEIDELRALTAHDMDYALSVEELAEVSGQKLAELAETIAMRSEGDLGGALSLIATDKGQALTERALALIAGITSEEQKRLDAALGHFDAVMRSSIITVCLSMLIAIATMLVTIFWFTKELRARFRIERDLRDNEHRLVQAQQRLRAIIATQQNISLSELDPEKIMKIVVDDVVALIGGSGAVVELIEGDELIYRSGSGPAAAMIGLRLKAQGSLSGLCARQRETLSCRDSEEDERVDRAACRKVGVRSMIAAPLLHDQDAIGALKVFSDQPDAFGDQDVKTVTLVAGLLGASLAHAAEFEAKKSAEQVALEASRLKSLFLANMSHEVRTPLNGIIGMARLLSESSLDADQRENLDGMERSAEALLAIVNDILDFSKIEAGKLDIEITDFDLDQVISDLGKITSYAARNKGLTFKIKMPAVMDTMFRGDSGRIRQVLGNLLSNAVKFTSRGGVELSLSVAASAAETILRFEVSDTGIGIGEQVLPRLFSAFTQADASTTRRYGGTGLGLSISKNLVEAMGGQIGVVSAAGQGSTFWFTLPLEKARARDHATRHALPEQILPELEGKRVLVAEDNPINQKIATAILTKFNCPSLIVGTGHEALAVLRERSFDLILMDCQMPELDGYEATKAIRASGEPWDKIPIVAMTANAARGDKERCIQAGMTDYVSKPIDPTLLAEALVRALRAVRASVQAVRTLADASLTTPILATDVLTDLQALSPGGARAFVDELIRDFVATTPVRLETLGQAIRDEDRSGIEQLAHALKGSAGSLGLKRLAQALQSLEDDASNASMSALHEHERLVSQDFSDARASLLDYQSTTLTEKKRA